MAGTAFENCPLECPPISLDSEAEACLMIFSFNDFFGLIFGMEGQVVCIQLDASVCFAYVAVNAFYTKKRTCVPCAVFGKKSISL